MENNENIQKERQLQIEMDEEYEQQDKQDKFNIEK